MEEHKEKNGNMFKTSISMPKSSLKTWNKYRALLEAKLPGLLARYGNQSPRRDRLVEYTHAGEPCERISVYWPINVYNELHSVASTLRVSVSRLLWLLLAIFEHGGKPREVFLKYSFVVHSWSMQQMHCTEILEFLEDDPDRSS